MALYLTKIHLHQSQCDLFMEEFEDIAESISCFENEEESKTSSVDEAAENWNLLIYNQTEPDKDIIESKLDFLYKNYKTAPVKYEISQMEEVDWVAESQKNFDAVEAGRFFIYPSWRQDEVPAGKYGIQIDPQRAFGTGGHQTTSGCLKQISKLAEDESNEFKNILDMGCGSGVLAIAMAKIWKNSKITAVDIDHVCVQTSIENFNINDISNDNIIIKESDGYKDDQVQNNEPYDLITSNILAKPLIEFAPEAAKNLAINGHLILAGLMSKQAGEVIEAHLKSGLTLVETKNIDDWTIIHLKKHHE